MCWLFLFNVFMSFLSFLLDVVGESMCFVHFPNYSIFFSYNSFFTQGISIFVFDQNLFCVYILWLCVLDCFNCLFFVVLFLNMLDFVVCLIFWFCFFEFVLVLYNVCNCQANGVVLVYIWVVVVVMAGNMFLYFVFDFVFVLLIILEQCFVIGSNRACLI